MDEFSAFLAGATGLPEEALAEGITEHVLTTKAIVDARSRERIRGLIGSPPP